MQLPWTLFHIRVRSCITGGTPRSGAPGNCFERSDSGPVTYFSWNNILMKQQKTKQQNSAQKSETAMIQGIIEGSPDAIGVAVVRLNCGCRKMAAVDKNGDPASKVIMYRDRAESICERCREDNGSFMRMTEQFIHWRSPEPDDSEKKKISVKVLGSKPH